MPTVRIFQLLVVGLLLAGRVMGAATRDEGYQTSPQASVLVCGGAMMNGNHFADTVLPVMREHYAGCRRVVLVLHSHFTPVASVGAVATASALLRRVFRSRADIFIYLYI